MTLASQTNRVTHAADSVTTEFAVPFKFLAATDLLVYLVDEDGVGTLQTLTTHYTVTGEGEEAGGEITFVTAPDADDFESVVIIRDVPLTQTADITADSSSPLAGTVEAALDKIWMAIQRMDDRLDRAVYGGEFVDPDDVPDYEDFVEAMEATLAAAAAIPVNYERQQKTLNGATAIVFSDGGYVEGSLTGNATLTFSGWPDAGISGRMTLEVRNTGAFGITWPAGIFWVSGAAPTVTSGNGKKDIFVFTTADGGTTIYGHTVGQNFVAV